MHQRHGLARRIATTFSVMATVFVVLVAGASYQVVEGLVRERVTEAARDAAQSFSEDAARRFRTIEQTLDSLAANTLIGNALVDDVGRDVYLRGFLSGFTTIADVPVEILVTDFRGAPFAGNTSRAAPVVLDNWIARVVETGATRVTVAEDKAGGAMVVLAAPVLFANTGLPEGALVFQVRLDELAMPDQTREHLSMSPMIHVATLTVKSPVDGRTVSTAVTDGTQGPRLDFVRPVAGGGLFGSLSPTISVGADASLIETALTDLLLAYLGLSGAAILVSFGVAVWAATLLTRRLTALQQAASALVDHADFHGRLPDDGDDEAGRLGRAFNSLLSRLDDAYEALRDQTRKALMMSEEKYSRVVDQAADGLIVLDSVGRVIEANQSAGAMLKRRHEDLIGLSARDIAPECSGPCFDEQFESLLEKPALTMATTFRDANGEDHPVEVRATAIETQGGHQILWMARDISSRLKAEAERAHLVERLEESNAELQQFAYVASHDLQEPLRMVTNYLKLLERRLGDGLDQDGRDFMDFAVDGAQRMNRLIQDLLFYSRLDTQAQPPVPTPMADVLGDALANLEVAIDEAGAEIVRPKTLPVVCGDATQLTSLMQNLIGNGVKYHAPDRPPRIEIAIERRDAEWRFSIADNGIGIEERFKERIFLVFQRLHGRGEYEGTGIGLAVCKKIVERHGGRIWVDSVPGKGSTFTFTLPADTQC